MIYAGIFFVAWILYRNLVKGTCGFCGKTRPVKRLELCLHPLGPTSMCKYSCLTQDFLSASYDDAMKGNY